LTKADLHSYVFSFDVVLPYIATILKATLARSSNPLLADISDTIQPTMSSAHVHNSNEACCSIPPVKGGEYKTKGGYEKVGEFEKAYVVSHREWSDPPSDT